MDLMFYGVIIGETEKRKNCNTNGPSVTMV